MQKPAIFSYFSRTLLICLLIPGFTACSILPSPTQKMSTVFSNAILNNNDLLIVKDGAPAYLLMLDALVEARPNSEELLRAASTLNGAYAGAFAEDPNQIKILSKKSLDFAQRAFCSRKKLYCNLKEKDFEGFNKIIEQTKNNDIDNLYTLGIAWAGWVQANSDDWNAVADLSKVKVIMNRVLTINENHDGGGAHLYLGVLDTLVPPSLGGKPELGRQHFEKAIELSNNTNLMYKVVFAEQYARLMFNRELHDQLLENVLNSPATVDGLTLVNTLAQERALFLLAGADDYF